MRWAGRVIIHKLRRRTAESTTWFVIAAAFIAGVALMTWLGVI